MPIRPAELGTVRLMNLIADCSTMQGRSGSGVATAPRTEMPDGMKVDWARISATTTHAGSAWPSSSAIVPKPMSASWLIEQVGGEDQGRHEHEVLRPNAAQRRDLRRPPCRPRRGGQPEILEGDLVRACQVAQMRCQCGALQVGQRAFNCVAPASFDGPVQRPLRADENGARDEELGNVDVERGLRRAERRRRQVDQHRPVVEDEDVARVEPAVGDARSMKPANLSPEILERLVAHLIGSARARAARRPAAA